MKSYDKIRLRGVIMMQVIFHIDLNAFYANAEIAVNPSLKNKPIVVAGDSRRSIITTASYEARKYGIHSAMPLYQAKEKCKDLIVVPLHRQLYEDYSSRFFDIIAEYSSALEVASIDECYVDVTSIVRQYASPVLLAKEIQDNILERLGLPCSIGVAPNKFLAKMASDMKKPLGITMLTHSNLKKQLWSLPISSMYGIGKRTYPKLEEIGIKTIGDLAKHENIDKLRPILGKNALIFYRKANGIDSTKINSNHNQLKSVGNSMTLEKDTNLEEEIKEVLRHLSHQVSSRSKKRGLVSNSISITLKYTRVESVVRSMIMNDFTNESDVIYENALILFHRHYDGRKIRLVGVSLNNVILENNLKKQLSLFEDEKKSLKSDTEKLIEEMNQSLGYKDILIKASHVQKKVVQKKYIKEIE